MVTIQLTAKRRRLWYYISACIYFFKIFLCVCIHVLYLNLSNRLLTTDLFSFHQFLTNVPFLSSYDGMYIIFTFLNTFKKICTTLLQMVLENLSYHPEIEICSNHIVQLSLRKAFLHIFHKQCLCIKVNRNSKEMKIAFI